MHIILLYVADATQGARGFNVCSPGAWSYFDPILHVCLLHHWNGNVYPVGKLEVYNLFLFLVQANRYEFVGVLEGLSLWNNVGTLMFTE